MKFILIAILAVNTQANLKSFIKEYMGSSQQKSTKYLWDNQKLLLEIEDSKRPFTLSYSGEMNDSSLEGTQFTSVDSEQRTHLLSLSKETIFGGEFSLTGTLYELESSSNYESFTQTLSYSQDLGKNFLGQSDRLSLEIARETEQYQELNYLKNTSTNLLDFISNYIDVRRDLTLNQLQKEALQRSKKRLSLVERQVRDGLKEKVDLYSSQTSHRFQIESVSQSESDLQTSKSILDTKLEREISLGELSPYLLSKEKLPSLPTGEVDNNLSVKSLNKKLSYLNKELESSQKSIFPTITLVGEYTTNNYENGTNPISDGTFGSDNSEKSIGLTISMPLGFEVAKTNKRIAKLNQLHAQYEKKIVVSKMKNTIENIRSQLSFLDKNIASVTMRYSLAKKTLKEYNKLYNRGRADLDQVIRAEESLISTEQSFIQYKSKRDKLFYALLDLYGDLQGHVSK